MSERYGDWIKTFTEKTFYPFDPRLEEICIEDIAHALSNLCRFTGHTKEFYSVGQHSVLAARYVAFSIHPSEADVTLGALLHDASEAYFGDMSRPNKRTLGKNNVLCKADKELQSLIFRKFGLEKLTPEDMEKIHKIDNVLLMTEGRDLMNGTQGWHEATDIIPLTVEIVPLLPKQVEEMFLQTFHSLRK